MFLVMFSAQLASVMCLAIALVLRERHPKLADAFALIMLYACCIACGALVLGGVYHLVRWIGD